MDFFCYFLIKLRRSLNKPNKEFQKSSKNNLKHQLNFIAAAKLTFQQRMQQSTLFSSTFCPLLHQENFNQLLFLKKIQHLLQSSNSNISSINNTNYGIGIQHNLPRCITTTCEHQCMSMPCTPPPTSPTSPTNKHLYSNDFN